MKPFKEVIDGIRKAVMASEVREDLAQMGEYVEQFANTAGENIQKAIDPTLSLSGKAADAAKVGEAVNAESERAKAAEEENAQGIGLLKENIIKISDDAKQYTEEIGTIIDSSKFVWGLINDRGEVIPTKESPLKNILSKLLSINGTVITPIRKDTIFKVVYYTENGTHISSTTWMGLIANPALKNYTVVENYTVVGDYCRLCFADAMQSVGTESIEQHLDKYRFDGNLELFIKSEKVLEKSVSLPFNGFRLNPKLFKRNEKYYSKINPRDYYIKNTSGVVVYISPNGSHNADGLTVITPVKTLAEALAVENVNTIICLEGTYVSDTNYFSAQRVTKEVNIIGIGDVIFDNTAKPCIRFYDSIYCENIHFKGGNTAVACEFENAKKTATFYKCIFSESVANNGLAILGGNAYVIDCIAYGNAFDGFNYHAKGSVVNHSIEVNCRSYGNGTKRLAESDGQSSNATTSHDGSYIVRVNGDYQCCHGGVVADKECFSANYGCSSGVSTVTDPSYPDRMSNYWSSNADMYLYDCISYGSKYDTAKINGGKITSNIKYASNYSS